MYSCLYQSTFFILFLRRPIWISSQIINYTWDSQKCYIILSWTVHIVIQTKDGVVIQNIWLHFLFIHKPLITEIRIYMRVTLSSYIETISHSFAISLILNLILWKLVLLYNLIIKKPESTQIYKLYDDLRVFSWFESCFSKYKPYVSVIKEAFVVSSSALTNIR